jgi:hypothetical protein
VRDYRGSEITGWLLALLDSALKRMGDSSPAMMLLHFLLLVRYFEFYYGYSSFASCIFAFHFPSNLRLFLHTLLCVLPNPPDISLAPCITEKSLIACLRESRTNTFFLNVHAPSHHQRSPNQATMLLLASGTRMITCFQPLRAL